VESISALEAALSLPQETAAGFTAPDDVLHGNLLSAYKTFGMYAQCSRKSIDVMNLPPLQQGGALILVFAFIKWSQQSMPQLYHIERLFTSQNKLILSQNASFTSEIERLQTSYTSLMNHAIECFGNTLDKDEWNAIMNLLSTTATDSAASEPHKSFGNQSEGIVLITQYFTSPNEVTNTDIRKALFKNIQNRFISEIHMLTESYIDFSTLDDESGKVKQTILGKRLTFQDAFLYANQYLKGRLVIVANADIYFDNSLESIVEQSTEYWDHKLVALLKWKNLGNELSLSLRTDSQDAWISRPPIDAAVIERSDFELGRARCDNRIAHVFDQAGYDVSSPSFSVRAIELHNADRGAMLYPTRGAVMGLGRNVLISDRLS
jgi:hypothetical protein